MCTYFQALDQATKDYLQFLVKWQEKKGGNVQMVTIGQKGEETPRICIVTRGCAHIGVDSSTLDASQKPWVHKSVDPLPKLDPVKKKETY